MDRSAIPHQPIDTSTLFGVASQTVSRLSLGAWVCGKENDWTLPDATTNSNATLTNGR
jgi:hypothetical protein